MTSISQLHGKGLKYRGGYRGRRIAVTDLIEQRIRFSIHDFRLGESRVRDCDTYCIMQISIGGVMYVTWHSSAILAEFLADVRADGESNFPITDCMMYEGEDRGYYLMDADETSTVLTERQLQDMTYNDNHKTRRR